MIFWMKYTAQRICLLYTVSLELYADCIPSFQVGLTDHSQITPVSAYRILSAYFVLCGD